MPRGEEPEETRRPDLADPDSFAGVDELGALAHSDEDDPGNELEPDLDAPDAAYTVGGGSRGGIGGIGQLGDNLALGPVPDLHAEEGAELHELDDEGAPAEFGDENGPEARRDLMAAEAELNQRWPETKLEPSLTRIQALMTLLGEPNQGYPVVHIAGTNGKGSVARMVDSLLTRMGLRSGRYTSPHLQLVTERIALDGRPVSAARYAELYQDIAPYVAMVDGASEDGVPMSKFEVLTGMAFAAFADAPVEAAVLEAGMGGAWDATNVADAQVAVITPIGLDHTEYLGPTPADAAAEKAGIIKPGSVAVIGEQDPEVLNVLLKRTVEVDAAVARAGSEFGVLEREVAVGGQMLKLQGLGGVYDEIFLPLHGAHQAANAALALAAVEAFFGAGKDKQLVVEAVREAFAEVENPGRLERVRAAPAVLVDAAHNPMGARALAATITDEFNFHAARRGRRRAGRQGRARHPGRAGAGGLRRRGHAQFVAAVAAGRGPGGTGRVDLRRGPRARRRRPGDRDRDRDRPRGAERRPGGTARGRRRAGDRLRGHRGRRAHAVREGACDE